MIIGSDKFKIEIIREDVEGLHGICVTIGKRVFAVGYYNGKGV